MSHFVTRAVRIAILHLSWDHLAKRYTDAVIVEMQNRMQALETPPVFDTLYFGGGTPSAIPPGQLNRIKCEKRGCARCRDYGRGQSK